MQTTIPPFARGTLEGWNKITSTEGMAGYEHSLFLVFFALLLLFFYFSSTLLLLSPTFLLLSSWLLGFGIGLRVRGVSPRGLKIPLYSCSAVPSAPIPLSISLSPPLSSILHPLILLLLPSNRNPPTSLSPPLPSLSSSRSSIPLTSHVAANPIPACTKAFNLSGVAKSPTQ